jgi:outer membrane protein assembly factor BamB
LLFALALTAAPTSAAKGGWTRQGVGAISQPAPAEGRFLFYAQQSGSLRVVALNARDGGTVWTAAASPSDVTPGVAAVLAVGGGMVFYLAPLGVSGTAEVAAREAASGVVVWRSEPGTFFTWPEICADEPTVICVNGVTAAGWGQLRFALKDGRPLGLVPMGTARTPGRELARDLFDSGKRSPETLFAVANGRKAWEKPLARIFVVGHPSSDGGWNFDRLGSRGMFVGSVGQRPTIHAGRATVTLASSMTAGLALDNGRVLWRSAGLYGCGQPLPCPGRSEAGYSSVSATTGPSVGVRLVEHGTASFSVHGGTPRFSPDASVTLEGFDLATGKTRWSFNAGRNTRLMTGLSVPARIDSNTIAISDRRGQLFALDVRTGATRPIRATLRAWCEKTILYHLAHTGYYGGQGGLYVGQAGLSPCTASGQRSPQPATIPSLVRDIGATTSGITAWTDNHTVHAEPS